MYLLDLPACILMFHRALFICEHVTINLAFITACCTSHEATWSNILGALSTISVVWRCALSPVTVWTSPRDGVHFPPWRCALSPGTVCTFPRDGVHFPPWRCALSPVTVCTFPRDSVHFPPWQWALSAYRWRQPSSKRHQQRGVSETARLAKIYFWRGFPNPVGSSLPQPSSRRSWWRMWREN